MTHTASFSFRFLGTLHHRCRMRLGNCPGGFCQHGSHRGAGHTGHWARICAPARRLQPPLAARHATIRVGDHIETQAGGHVHLKFVDGGLLSVRPASRLYIESYSYSAQRPEQGAIKFQARRRRRPLHHRQLGVRLPATVSASTPPWPPSASRAPTSSSAPTQTKPPPRSTPEPSCSHPSPARAWPALGPCATGNEKVLSEDMRGLMVELGRQQVTPQLVAVADAAATGSAQCARCGTRCARPLQCNRCCAMTLPPPCLCPTTLAQ
jgi:hypothetical protein